MKMRTLKVKFPRIKKCPECKAATDWEMHKPYYGRVRDVTFQEIEMHHSTCSRSEYQKKRRACEASGGHDEEEVSAGSHSYFRCRKCGL